MWSTLPEKKIPAKSRMTLQYAIVKTTLDHLLVATLGADVRFVALDASPERLLSTMNDAFPSATVTNGTAVTKALAERLAAYVENPSESISQLYTGQAGTPFQQEVWKAIAAIPAGTTRSYAQLAEDAGRPKAVRAVAQACGRNDLALIVPCHRVVGSDGSMTGYRWGAGRKKLLLERESSVVRNATAIDN